MTQTLEFLTETPSDRTISYSLVVERSPLINTKISSWAIYLSSFLN
ncbi:hypothetical protein [Tolypothrix sp. VBCCA 56010]